MRLETDSAFSTRFRGTVVIEDIHRDDLGKVTSFHLVVEHAYRLVGPGAPRKLKSGAPSSPPLIRQSTFYSCMLVGEQCGPLLPFLADGKSLVGMAVKVGGTVTGGRQHQGRETILLRNSMVIPDLEALERPEEATVSQSEET